jgi:hypothetical protein
MRMDTIRLTTEINPARELATRNKCLHYYFYFMDKQLGLCYVRVPTWLPCRRQIFLPHSSRLGTELSLVRTEPLQFSPCEVGQWSTSGGG